MDTDEASQIVYVCHSAKLYSQPPAKQYNLLFSSLKPEVGGLPVL